MITVTVIFKFWYEKQGRFQKEEKKNRKVNVLYFIMDLSFGIAKI